MSPEFQKMLAALEEDEAEGKPILLIQEKEPHTKAFANGSSPPQLKETHLEREEEREEPGPPFASAVLHGCEEEEDLEGRLIQLQIQELTADSPSADDEGGFHAGML